MAEIELYLGDCVNVMRKHIDDKSVQCCVTSPPYYGLRQYLFDKAVVLRCNLSQEDLDYVKKELKRLGIKPRFGRQISEG